MAADEEQPQPFVGDRLGEGNHIAHAVHLGLAGDRPRLPLRLAPRIERAPPRGDVSPRRRIADRRFLAQGRLARRRKRVFGEVEIAELRGKGCDDPGSRSRKRISQNAQTAQG
ncbi:hypothetical protein [Citromicrobium bathyomarinum]|uniref:hypothetical protein n=1 Tax=Citromicrobium bathyomarinum TaxID=72174 RepID=UPI00315A4115